MKRLPILIFLPVGGQKAINTCKSIPMECRCLLHQAREGPARFGRHTRLQSAIQAFLRYDVWAALTADAYAATVTQFAPTTALALKGFSYIGTKST